MKVSLTFLAVAALCAALANGQFRRPNRQGRLFPFGWRSALPFSRRTPAPIRLYRFYPSQPQQYPAPANSFQPIPLRFASQQQQVVAPFQPSNHFHREHAAPQASSGFSSYSSIDELPLEPFDQSAPSFSSLDGSRPLPVLRDDDNPPPIRNNQIVEDSDRQVAIVPIVDMYQQLNLVEGAQPGAGTNADQSAFPGGGFIAGNVPLPSVPEAGYPMAEIVAEKKPERGFINMFYGAAKPVNFGQQVVPVAAVVDISPSPADIRPEPVVVRDPQATNLFDIPIQYSGAGSSDGLHDGPEVPRASDQEFDQPKIQSILEVNPIVYLVQEENPKPELSFDNVRVIQTILPPSRSKSENPDIAQGPDPETESVLVLNEEEFDELAKGIAESIVIIPSPEVKKSDQDDSKPVIPILQRNDALIESDSSQDEYKPESDLEGPEKSSAVPPPPKDIPIRATPSILIEQLKQNYPPKSIQESIASAENNPADRPVSSDASFSELISGSSGAIPVISVPEISGLYLTPTADEHSIFGGGIGGLPLQDHRTGEASANVGVAVLPEAIPVDGKTRGKGYRFSYSVEDDHSGTSFSRFEQSDGELTQGQYRVLLPDGRTQVVKFFDDGLGYQADVAYI